MYNCWNADVNRSTFVPTVCTRTGQEGAGLRSQLPLSIPPLLESWPMRLSGQSTRDNATSQPGQFIGHPRGYVTRVKIRNNRRSTGSTRSAEDEPFAHPLYTLCVLVTKPSSNEQSSTVGQIWLNLITPVETLAAC